MSRTSTHFFESAGRGGGGGGGSVRDENSVSLSLLQLLWRKTPKGAEMRESEEIRRPTPPYSFFAPICRILVLPQEFVRCAVTAPPHQDSLVYPCVLSPLSQRNIY